MDFKIGEKISYLSYGKWKTGEVIGILNVGNNPMNILKNVNFKYRASSNQYLDNELKSKSLLIATEANKKGTRLIYIPKISDIKDLMKG